MVEVRLYAQSIDEVRDMFGAEPETAATLRAIASDRFRVPVAANRPTGMLSKIGPLFRRDTSFIVPEGTPTQNDIETLVAGKFVAPERLETAWTVVEAWLDALAWGRHVISTSQAHLNDIEFDLARSGVPSQFSIEKLLVNDPQLPLRAAPRMRVGYRKYEHIVATRDALQRASEHIVATSHAVVDDLILFLDHFDHWHAQAAPAGRPGPDLIMIWKD